MIDPQYTFQKPKSFLLPSTVTSNNFSIRENIGTNRLDSRTYLYNSLELSSWSKFALEVCDNVVAMFEF